MQKEQVNIKWVLKSFICSLVETQKYYVNGLLIKSNQTPYLSEFLALG